MPYKSDVYGQASGKFDLVTRMKPSGFLEGLDAPILIKSVFGAACSAPAYALGVVAGEDQHLCGDIHADPKRFAEGGFRLSESPRLVGERSAV